MSHYAAERERDLYAVIPGNFEKWRARLDLEPLLTSKVTARRMVRERECVFRAGQLRTSIYLVHSGFFRTSITSADGRERITGFQMRGDLLGLDSIDMPHYQCEVMALDVGEVWQIPYGLVKDHVPEFNLLITSALSSEIRRDWSWMLSLSTLCADQRVVTYLLDLASQLEGLGFSGSLITLRMTRAELANFLSLQLETVTRVLMRLEDRGLLKVNRRRIDIVDRQGLMELLQTVN